MAYFEELLQDFEEGGPSLNYLTGNKESISGLEMTIRFIGKIILH